MTTKLVVVMTTCSTLHQWWKPYAEPSSWPTGSSGCFSQQSSGEQGFGGRSLRGAARRDRAQRVLALQRRVPQRPARRVARIAPEAAGAAAGRPGRVVVVVCTRATAREGGGGEGPCVCRLSVSCYVSQRCCCGNDRQAEGMVNDGNIWMRGGTGLGGGDGSHGCCDGRITVQHVDA